MDTTTISLLFGSLGVGLFWWGAKRLARRCSGKVAQPDALQNASSAERTEAPIANAFVANAFVANAPASDEATLEQTAQVYRKILYLRLAGFALCLLAAGSLFFNAGTVVAVVLAGVGLYMQYLAYRTRTQHVFAVKNAVERRFLDGLKSSARTPCAEEKMDAMCNRNT